MSIMECPRRNNFLNILILYLIFKLNIKLFRKKIIYNLLNNRLNGKI